jgi:mycothiol synthase
MGSSPPDGVGVRDATAADIEAAARLVRAEERFIRGESIWDVADLSDFWRYANFDGGSWIVEHEGVPVAFAACIYLDDLAECWSTVHPDFFGRGLGTFLLARAEEHARNLGRRAIRAGTFAENPAGHGVLVGRGYREVRRYFQMRIDLDSDPEPASWPEGIEPAAFRPDDARAFHRAVQEAFADEWGFHALPFDEWRRTRLEAPDTDTSLWFLARDGDEIAGVVRCEPTRDGGGWIGALGVLKPWRRRGVGLALLLHAFSEFRRRGEHHVGLGVDAQNPTGATRLYERAGMHVIKEDVIYEKALV